MIRLRPICVLLFCFFTAPLYAQKQSFSLYLIGDAGEPTLPTNGLKELLQKKYDPSVQSVVIFLGDNIYPKGLPAADENGRAEAESILKAQLNLLEGFNSDIYFIPGNHDWKKGQRGGLKQINNEEAWIDSLHNDKIHFQPEEGCPGPVEVPLGKDAVLVIIDSQWFLHPWDKPEGDDSPC